MPDSAPANPPDAATAAAAPPPPSPAAAKPAKANNSTRTRLFIILGVVILVGLIFVFANWLLVGRFHVSTDNAYVDADTAEITPQVAGQVIEVAVGETSPVKAGQMLVRIDDTDAKVALEQAQAQLGQAERKVKGYFANAQALGGQVDARQADITRADAMIASAQADLDRASTELARRQRLATSGAVSGDELTQAQNQFRTAQASVAAARAQRLSAVASRVNAQGSAQVNAALISGAGVDENPEVAAARAKVEAAQLDFDRTVLRSPVDGVVAKKNVAVGQRVPIGASLMSVVPIEQAYVDANFKEVQLKNVRIGQPAIVTSDYWGGGVKFHGVVVGLAGGTGAAFSLIPAQNATGNWIKVVQRLPVRIQLRADELRAHPLRVGLSMNASIDVSKHD